MRTRGFRGLLPVGRHLKRRSIVVSWRARSPVAHILGDCSCHGGTRSGQPGTTLREDARLACEAFVAWGGEFFFECVAISLIL